MKPGGGGCRQGVGKSQWKNQLHRWGSVKKPHTGLEKLGIPQTAWGLIIPCKVKPQSGVIGKVFMNCAYGEKLPDS